MEYPKETIPKRKTTQNPPPKRGQVKMRIFKSIAAVLSCSNRMLQEEEAEEYGVPVPLSSTSTTPPIPSGYTSELQTRSYFPFCFSVQGQGDADIVAVF